MARRKNVYRFNTSPGPSGSAAARSTRAYCDQAADPDGKVRPSEALLKPYVRAVLAAFGAGPSEVAAKTTPRGGNAGKGEDSGRDETPDDRSPDSTRRPANTFGSGVVRTEARGDAVGAIAGPPGGEGPARALEVETFGRGAGPAVAAPADPTVFRMFAAAANDRDEAPRRAEEAAGRGRRPAVAAPAQPQAQAQAPNGGPAQPQAGAGGGGDPRAARPADLTPRQHDQEVRRLAGVARREFGDRIQEHVGSGQWVGGDRGRVRNERNAREEIHAFLKDAGATDRQAREAAEKAVAAEVRELRESHAAEFHRVRDRTVALHNVVARLQERLVQREARLGNPQAERMEGERRFVRGERRRRINRAMRMHPAVAAQRRRERHEEQPQAFLRPPNPPRRTRRKGALPGPRRGFRNVGLGPAPAEVGSGPLPRQAAEEIAPALPGPVETGGRGRPREGEREGLGQAQAAVSVWSEVEERFRRLTAENADMQRQFLQFGQNMLNQLQMAGRQSGWAHQNIRMMNMRASGSGLPSLQPRAQGGGF